MAQKLPIANGPLGLKFLYNVSKHVGPSRHHPNDPDDVQLVQFLFREVNKSSTTLPPGLASPVPTGIFDTTTGFWIYHIQASFLPTRPGTIVDGVISPAKGLNYSGLAAWTIGHLNGILKSKFPEVFDGIPNNPELRPSLRASFK